MSSSMLARKRILLTGVVPRSSIAYHVAERAQQNGAEDAFGGNFIDTPGWNAEDPRPGAEEAADLELVGATTSPDELR